MLGLEAADIGFQPLWVKAGREQLVIPLTSEAAVRRVRPKAELFEKLKSVDGAGQAYVFASTGAKKILSRFFFPDGAAILEDPATGSACANLGGWFIAMGRRPPLDFEVSQGEFVGRPSTAAARGQHRQRSIRRRRSDRDRIGHLEFVRSSSMSTDSYHKRKVGNRVLQPETQMMGYGFDPALSEGSLKPPIFLTSTFVFRNAQDGKDFFDYTSGRRAAAAGQGRGPGVLALQQSQSRSARGPARRCGKAARARRCSRAACRRSRPRCGPISSPNDLLLMSEPLYGGTETLIDKTMPAFGIGAVRVADAINREAVMAGAKSAVEKAKAQAAARSGC